MPDCSSHENFQVSIDLKEKDKYSLFYQTLEAEEYLKSYQIILLKWIFGNEI